MQARRGDRIVIGGGAERLRRCQVLEVRTDHGPFRYLVEWEDTGKQDLLVPGGGDLTVIPQGTLSPEGAHRDPWSRRGRPWPRSA